MGRGTEQGAFAAEILRGITDGITRGMEMRQQRQLKEQEFSMQQKRLDLDEHRTLNDDLRQQKEDKRKALVDEAELRLKGLRATPEGTVEEIPENELLDSVKNERALQGAKAEGAKLDLTKTRAEINKINSEIGKKPENKDLKLIPEEDQILVKDLSRSNAGKISIANQLDASVVSLKNEKVDPKVKMQIAKQMIKTLNSTEGKDAVGAEEAKRMGEFLEPYTLNPFGARGISIGQDLPKFIDQVETTSAAIRGAIASNNQEVDRIYEKHGVNRKKSGTTMNPNQKRIDAYLAHKAALNPGDPKIKEIDKAIGKLNASKE